MKIISFNTKIKMIGRRFRFGIFSVHHVRNILTFSICMFALAGAVFSTLYLEPAATATTCTTNPCNTTFQVNVKETLTVSVTTPSTWASGNVGNFLRNKVNVSVDSNNANGFTASMYSQSSTNLTNTAKSTVTLPTLTADATCTTSACLAFPENRWGYSLNDGTYTGTYHAMTTNTISPITIMSAGAGTTTGSQDIYFGAKANISQASGTYAGTVVISVVTGTIDSNTNPITPSNPATPGLDTANDNQATYINGTTVYTTTSSDSTNQTDTVTTQVSDGNVAASYPLGETEDTTSNINGSSLATGLAATATAAAASGIFFFILAKRRKDEDEEEE